MYLTFCMAIDKLYIPDEFEDNFHHYFEYEKIQKSEYIPLDKFQSYLESASKETLIKNSRFIIQKYFEIWWFELMEDNLIIKELYHIISDTRIHLNLNLILNIKSNGQRTNFKIAIGKLKIVQESIWP